MKYRTSIPLICTAAGFCILLFVSAVGMLQADTTLTTSSKPAAAAEALTLTNNLGELHLTQQALERLRNEIEANASRNTTAITSGLAMLEPALAQLHKSQMALVQSSNKTIITVASIFAGVGFVTLMSIVFILVRAMGRFSEMAGNASRGVMLNAAPAPAALGTGDLVNVNATAVEQASTRFQHAIEHLQKRIFELEHTAQPAAVIEAAKPQSPARPPAEPLAAPALNISQLPSHDLGTRKSPEATEAASHASLLLGKGQALLNLDQADQALECFDEILALDPNNTEALLRRGLALEKLESWEKALECYERSLAIDSSLTVAYLYKGGVCNKLQRHREALDSYEHALHTEKRSRAS